MEPSTTDLIAKKVCGYEILAILLIVALIWLDEIIDIPYVLLGGPEPPINWRESLFESVIIIAAATVIIRHTYTLLLRVAYLEQALPACASCKKIRVDNAFWFNLEQFMTNQAHAGFVHGICPDCIKRYSPELHEYQATTAKDTT